MQLTDFAKIINSIGNMFCNMNAVLKIRVGSWYVGHSFKVGTLLQTIIGFPIGNVQ